MAESNPTHDHIEFVTESVAGLRACTGCGAMVPSTRTADHQAFHDRVQLALSAISQHNATHVKSAKKSKK